MLSLCSYATFSQIKLWPFSNPYMVSVSISSLCSVAKHWILDVVRSIQRKLPSRKVVGQWIGILQWPCLVEAAHVNFFYVPTYHCNLWLLKNFFSATYFLFKFYTYRNLIVLSIIHKTSLEGVMEGIWGMLPRFCEAAWNLSLMNMKLIEQLNLVESWLVAQPWSLFWIRVQCRFIVHVNSIFNLQPLSL